MFARGFLIANEVILISSWALAFVQPSQNCQILRLEAFIQDFSGEQKK
jgi:hypothetical protein